MLVLTAEDVRKALPMRDAIEAMKRAYAALSDGRANVPLRTRIDLTSHEALSLFMPAFVQAPEADGPEGDIPEREALAIKVVSLFPQNPVRGLAYIQAVVLVLEPDSGRALALLEGSSLTAIRTGAASGAAIDLLARKDSHVVAVFGAGTQARTQLEAACTVRNVERVFIYDRQPDKAAAFAGEMAGRGPIPETIRIAATPAEAVLEADIICTATTSLHAGIRRRRRKSGYSYLRRRLLHSGNAGGPGGNHRTCPRGRGFPPGLPGRGWRSHPAVTAQDSSMPPIFMPNWVKLCWDGKQAGFPPARSRTSSLLALLCRMLWQPNWPSIMHAE